MQVILRTDLPNVGKRGDVIDDSTGSARNYLLPKFFAMMATAGADAQAMARRRSRDLRDAAARSAAEEVAKTLVPATITVTARAGTGGKLFGSGGTTDIAEAIQAQTGLEVDRKQLHLDEPIKEAGTHHVPAKLHTDVEFQVTVEVVTD